MLKAQRQISKVLIKSLLQTCYQKKSNNTFFIYNQVRRYFQAYLYNQILNIAFHTHHCHTRHIYLILLYIYIRPKQFTEPALKSQQPTQCREDYIAYKSPIYPDGSYYELTEEDIHFLSTINEKLANPVTIEDFELYLSILDSKSGKDVEIDFTDFQRLKVILPKSITIQSATVQEQLHSYFKKQRVQTARPLTRGLMHPYYEDNNPHLAFRPRTAPSERTMRLRRGNPQNQRGLSEMENAGQKIVALKRDLSMVSNLIDQCLQREKALEIERRIQFCRFIKEFYDHSKKNTDQGQWSLECFVRECKERSTVNAQDKADELNSMISREVVSWKEQNEILKKDRINKEENINKFEQLISDMVQVTSEPVPVQQPIIPPPIQQSQLVIHQLHIIDEQQESLVRFFVTLYLEARKFQLSFDEVMSNSFPIFKQTSQQKTINSIYPFKLMHVEGSDLIYKSEFDNDDNTSQKYYWEQDTLYSSYDYFRQKLNDLMEIADMDQMINTHGQEEHDDEEQKLWRKKVKISQTRSFGINGSIK